MNFQAYIPMSADSTMALSWHSTIPAIEKMVHDMKNEKACDDSHSN